MEGKKNPRKNSVVEKNTLGKWDILGLTGNKKTMMIRLQRNGWVNNDVTKPSVMQN